MQIPIYIDGKKEGALTVEREGPVTVMRGELRDVGRVVRLTVYGERAGYLGVPEPAEGRLRITRRLSPMEMNRFPQHPEYAAEGPLDRPAPQTKRREPEEAAEPARRHVLWMGGKPYYF